MTSASQAELVPGPPAGSTLALWSGIGFSFAFTALIWYAGANWLQPGALTPDRPGFWYEWQLQEPTLWSRASAWGLYLLHQLTIWALIWRAQQANPGYTAGLHRFNVMALAANALFITLHLVQTHIWYDGLAQDVHETTAQWSVIVLLVAVLVMENQRRGLVFGYRSAFVTEAGRTLRKYHGYYFAWATIYTFWYHPMEYTSGHLLGFLYMFLLLIQGSLFFTRMHVNRYWTIVQEVSVAAHGAMVAWMQSHGWQMFAAGFLSIFVVTQMHGLGLGRRARWLIGLAYVVAVAILYWSRGYDRLPEIVGIPLTELAGVVVLSAIVLAVTRLLARRRGVGAGASAPAPTAARQTAN